MLLKKFAQLKLRVISGSYYLFLLLIIDECKSIRFYTIKWNES